MRLAPLVFLAASAAAQSADPASPAAPDTTLDAVTVTAAREPVATAEAPSRVTVVDRRALAATAAASLADALQARAPVHVRRYGPSGLASVTIRGASSSQALVLLDGQRLTDPALGQVDLGLLPAALLESVEVLSGPASGLYGSDAVGGVVGLRTPAAGTARVTTEAGPWGERRLSGAGTGRVGPARLTAAADLGRSTDDYSFVDAGRIDGARATRQGWDSRRATAYVAGATGGERSRAGVSLWAADAERGLGGTADPGPGPGQAVGARQWDGRLRIGATAAHTAGRVQLEAAGHVQRTRLRYASPFPAGDRADAIDDTGRTATTALDLRATLPVGAGRWTGSLQGGRGEAEHPSLASAATDRFAGAALAGRQPFGAVTLFPALRADLYAPDGAARRLAVAPQLGLNADLGGPWRLKASAARAFRMPTLNDRYWMPGGNPDLRPEAAWSADAGAVWGRGAAQVEATAFATTARDQIVWAPTAGGFWAPENVARTRSLGLEVSAQAARPVRVAGRRGLATLGALATALDARDLGSGQPLRYVPRASVKAWAGLDLGALGLDLGARWTGTRFTTASASLPLPPHLVVDGQVSARRRLGTVDLDLGLALENLTGLQYEVVRSYPMPPRHARLRLTLSPR